MKIKAGDLENQLGFVMRGTLQRTGGMYSLVCLERTPDGVFLRSFNQVAHSLARIAGSEEAGGEHLRILFNPKPLAGAISRVDGMLHVEVDEESFSISITGPVRVDQRGRDGANFIDFPMPEAEPVSLENATQRLARSMGSAYRAVDKNHTNARFAGVYLGDRHTPGTVCAVGTNATSLVEVEIGSSEGLEAFEGESIIPAVSMDQIRKLLDASEESVNLYLTGRQASFVGEKRALCTQVISEKYPNYASILPDMDECQEIQLPRRELETALRICDEYTEDFSAVFLDFEEGGLTVRSTEAEAGGASYEIEAETGDMGVMRLKGSAERLLEVVGSLSTPQVVMYVPMKQEPDRIGFSPSGLDGMRGACALMYLQPGEGLGE